MNAYKFPSDGPRRHRIMTATVARSLPALYSTERDPDPIVRTRFFSPYSGHVFLATEFDGEDTLFGYIYSPADGGELGYFSLSELAGVMARIGSVTVPAIERDLYWEPMPLRAARSEYAAA